MERWVFRNTRNTLGEADQPTDSPENKREFFCCGRRGWCLWEREGGRGVVVWWGGLGTNFLFYCFLFLFLFFSFGFFVFLFVFDFVFLWFFFFFFFFSLVFSSIFFRKDMASESVELRYEEAKNPKSMTDLSTELFRVCYFKKGGDCLTVIASFGGFELLWIAVFSLCSCCVLWGVLVMFLIVFVSHFYLIGTCQKRVEQCPQRTCQLQVEETNS